MLLAAGLLARGGAHGGPGFIFPLFILLLIGLLVWWLIRRRRGGAPRTGPGSPLQTLEERFARGEIDREEFEHRKAVLDGEDVVPPAPSRPAPPSAPSPGTGESAPPPSGPEPSAPAGGAPATGQGVDDTDVYRTGSDTDDES